MKNKEKIILIGGGGHCKVVIDALRKIGKFEIAGIVDANPALARVAGIKVIGSDDNLKKIFASKCKNAFVTVGSVGDPSARIRLAKKAKSAGFRLPAIIHPSAVIAENVSVGEGTFVAAGAVIGPETRIGSNVIINTNSSVDHDCVISDFVHIAPGASLSGGVKIGARSHIGTRVSVIEQISIGSDTVIGAGSTVVSNIPGRCRAIGTPCKPVGKNSE